MSGIPKERATAIVAQIRELSEQHADVTLANAVKRYASEGITRALLAVLLVAKLSEDGVKILMKLSSAESEKARLDLLQEIRELNKALLESEEEEGLFDYDHVFLAQGAVIRAWRESLAKAIKERNAKTGEVNSAIEEGIEKLQAELAACKETLQREFGEEEAALVALRSDLEAERVALTEEKVEAESTTEQAAAMLEEARTKLAEADSAEAKSAEANAAAQKLETMMAAITAESQTLDATKNEVSAMLAKARELAEQNAAEAKKIAAAREALVGLAGSCDALKGQLAGNVAVLDPEAIRKLAEETTRSSVAETLREVDAAKKGALQAIDKGSKRVKKSVTDGTQEMINQVTRQLPKLVSAVKFVDRWFVKRRSAVAVAVVVVLICVGVGTAIDVINPGKQIPVSQSGLRSVASTSETDKIWQTLSLTTQAEITQEEVAATNEENLYFAITYVLGSLAVEPGDGVQGVFDEKAKLALGLAQQSPTAFEWYLAMLKEHGPPELKLPVIEFTAAREAARTHSQ